jgi:hypothetical protein
MTPRARTLALDAERRRHLAARAALLANWRHAADDANPRYAASRRKRRGVVPVHRLNDR